MPVVPTWRGGITTLACFCRAHINYWPVWILNPVCVTGWILNPVCVTGWILNPVCVTGWIPNLGKHGLLPAVLALTGTWDPTPT